MHIQIVRQLTRKLKRQRAISNMGKRQGAADDVLESGTVDEQANQSNNAKRSSL